MAKTTNGTKKAIRAAAQMGMMLAIKAVSWLQAHSRREKGKRTDFLRSGYAMSG